MSKKVLLYGSDLDFMKFIKSVLSQDYMTITQKTICCKPSNNSQLQIKTGNFDYIVICEPKRNENNKIKDTLMRCGIPEACIIQPYALSWKERFFDSTYEDLLSLDTPIDGLIVGPSHSQWGILPEMLDKRFFKLSLCGCDLFTAHLWLTKLIENKKKLIQKLKYLIIDMPYYIFNWSILDTTHFYYRIGYFNTINLDDYCTDQQRKNYLRGYDIMKKMFLDKYKQGFVDLHTTETHLGDITASWVWNQLNESVISQNTTYYAQAIKKILEVNPNIKICNVIIPCEKTFIKHNKNAINIAKDKFSEILSAHTAHPNIDTLDLFNYSNYMQTNHFLDYLHLNYNGAKRFTRYLNKKLKLMFY